MKTVGFAMIAAAALSLSVAPAFARCGSDAVVQGKLKRYGFDEDPSTFSNTKMAQVCNALSSSERKASDTKRNIAAALKSN